MRRREEGDGGAEKHDEEGTAGVHDGGEGQGREEELGDGAVDDDGDSVIDDGLAVAGEGEEGLWGY